nr:MAG TPA: hypothetical protein [Caudoviricetes sp.]
MYFFNEIISTIRVAKPIINDIASYTVIVSPPFGDEPNSR